MAASSQVTIGAHRVVFEAADQISVYLTEGLTEQEMEAVIDAQAAFTAGRQYYLILDFTRISTISAGVRRAIGRSTGKIRFHAIAMYGASFHMKIMAKLVNTALALFAKRAFPQEFFDTREAALTWVEQQRKQHEVQRNP